MNKTRMFRAALRCLNGLSPCYFDRGLTIATGVAPAVFAREALYHIRNSSRKTADLDDVLQFLTFAAPLAQQSSGEFYQDLWALWEANGKRDGFFVEFGAADGKQKSNTYFLEKDMNWNGIVAEPNPNFVASVRRHRSCTVFDKCVYSRSGERIEFLASRVGELSRIAAIDPKDGHDRSDHAVVVVLTISLNDLLVEGNAPRDIDFLSIDTEGSEYEILSHFDFDKWNLHTIAVEHNGTKVRDKIFELLTRHGYRRKWPEMSYCDDWYVRA
jgi:FkbM family methyltransferase